jgi:hypothetical protein
MKYLTITNFKRYQHYTDREIKWVKWYVSSLKDHKVSKLSDAERWVFVGILSLAATEDNTIPLDIPWIKRLVCHEHTTNKSLELAIKHLVLLQILNIVDTKLPKSASTDKKR